MKRGGVHVNYFIGENNSASRNKAEAVAQILRANGYYCNVGWSEVTPGCLEGMILQVSVREFKKEQKPHGCLILIACLGIFLISLLVFALIQKGITNCNIT